MDTQKVDCYLISNGNKFPEESLAALRDKLIATDQAKELVLSIIQFKDPTVALILSLLVGSLGIDRFYIGDNGIGIAKLLTCGGVGIWAIIDWFLIMNATKRKNIEKITFSM
ncbi:MAG: TM2 domain-containing protein [Bacteroidales bacterium]